MQVYADANVRLEALGLEDDVSPLVLQAFCQQCDQLLYERIYVGGIAEAQLVAEAHHDGALDLAHVCWGA